MKKIRNLARFAFFALMVTIVSCEKILDYFPGKPKNCRIKRIHFFQVYSDYYGDFYYNKWGNPDSVKFGFVATGAPNMYFKYNNRKQLIEARFPYSNGGYENWHKYGYTGTVITTDTSYSFGDASREPEPDNYYSKTIAYLEYDELGRIIRETRDPVDRDYPPTVLNYSYDSNGNLIGYYLKNYDNYTNIHTLNPVWSFVFRNYSLNNPIPATTYNNFRLPLVFDQPISFLEIYSFRGRSLEKSVIEYDCK